MGNKGGKDGKSASKASNKPAAKEKASKVEKLSDKDYKFFATQTGLTKAEIDGIHARFEENNPDHLLDKAEFVRLYHQLRSEPPELVNDIAGNVFTAFDTDHNGKLTFKEFLV